MLLGITASEKIINACWRESAKPLLYYSATVHFHSKQDMIPLACVQDPACIWDPAYNRDPASISTNYIDLRPVSETRRLCGTRLLPEVLRYYYFMLVLAVD